MNKKQEMAEQTRMNLQEAFWNLYKEKPIEKITIKEVTNLAGYNRGTFYLYYKDIYDMLTSIEGEILIVIDNFVQKWMSESIGEEWFGYVAQLIEWFQSYSPYVSVLLSNTGDPDFVRKLKDILRPVIHRWNVAVECLPEDEQEILTEFHLSGIIAALSTWLSQEKRMSFESFVGFMMNHFFQGYQSEE